MFKRRWRVQFGGKPRPGIQDMFPGLPYPLRFDVADHCLPLTLSGDEVAADQRSRDGTGRNHPHGRLACHRRDRVEIPVIVEHHEAVDLGTCRNEQIDRFRGAM